MDDEIHPNNIHVGDKVEFIDDIVPADIELTFDSPLWQEFYVPYINATATCEELTEWVIVDGYSCPTVIKVTWLPDGLTEYYSIHLFDLCASETIEAVEQDSTFESTWF